MPFKKNDLTGQKFGKLTALVDSGLRVSGNVKWECLCDCGNRTVVASGSLRNGGTVSCGCVGWGNARKFKKAAEGLRVVPGADPTYVSWVGMRQRCLYPRHRSYHSYGGRGIAVCERWGSFENFLADMGLRPEGTTLDRIDSEKDYEPGNCRWSTAKEQANNRRSSRKRAA